jgi:hypothetical protein
MILRFSTIFASDNQRARIVASARPAERASSIVEAMVGSVILSMVALSVYSGISFGFKTVQVANENVRADQIIVDKLETIEVYSWPKLISGTFVPTNFTSYSSSPIGTNTVGSGTVYRGTLSITAAPVTESYSNTLLQVKVDLAWTSSGIPRSRTMSTFISQYGVQAYKN